MSIYREQATDRTVLFCPRCNELLDQLDFGVDICPRCEGFWIGASVLELSGNQWPTGPQMWWRRELRCPACATQGVVTVMNARTSSDVVIDQCFAHGVWLDRGELSRVMRDPVVKGLKKLREHLAALEPSADELEQRRIRWEGEQEDRARLGEIERKRIEAERMKRVAEEAKTDAQRAEERRVAQAAKIAEAEKLAQTRRDAERTAGDRRAEFQRVHAELRIEEDRMAIAEAERARRTPEPVNDRDAARAVELARTRVAALEQHRLAAERRDEEARSQQFSLDRQRRELERRVDYLAARVDSLRLQLRESEEELVKARSDLLDTRKQLEAGAIE